MNSFGQFLDITISHLGAAFMTILGQTILFALLGLTAGILLVNFARKRKLFNRSFGLWTFVAKLNYIYIPVLFMIFGGGAGILSGTHSAAGNIVNAASDEFVKHAQGFVPDFQNFLEENKMILAGKSTQDLVDAHLRSKKEMGWTSRIVMRAFNVVIVRHCMKKLNVKDAVNDPFVLAESFSKEDMATAVLSIPSMAIKSHLDWVFLRFFGIMCMMFSFYFMLPIYEFGLHLLVSKLFGKSSNKNQTEFAV